MGLRSKLKNAVRKHVKAVGNIALKVYTVSTGGYGVALGGKKDREFAKKTRKVARKVAVVAAVGAAGYYAFPLLKAAMVTKGPAQLRSMADAVRGTKKLAGYIPDDSAPAPIVPEAVQIETPLKKASTIAPLVGVGIAAIGLMLK